MYSTTSTEYRGPSGVFGEIGFRTTAQHDLSNLCCNCESACDIPISIQVDALHESAIQQLNRSNFRPSLDHFFRRFITVFLEILHKQTS